MSSFRNSAKDLCQTPMAHGLRGSQSGREKIRQMTTRVTEGARRPPRCLAASPLNAPVRACSPLTESEEKEKLLAG